MYVHFVEFVNSYVEELVVCGSTCYTKWKTLNKWTYIEEDTQVYIQMSE